MDDRKPDPLLVVGQPDDIGWIDQSDWDAALALLRRIDETAPRRQGSHVYAAQIPWSIIKAVRAFLEAGPGA